MPTTKMTTRWKQKAPIICLVVIVLVLGLIVFALSSIILATSSPSHSLEISEERASQKNNLGGFVSPDSLTPSQMEYPNNGKFFTRIFKCSCTSWDSNRVKWH